MYMYMYMHMYMYMYMYIYIYIYILADPTLREFRSRRQDLDSSLDPDRSALHCSVRGPASP